MTQTHAVCTCMQTKHMCLWPIIYKNIVWLQSMSCCNVPLEFCNILHVQVVCTGYSRMHNMHWPYTQWSVTLAQCSTPTQARGWFVSCIVMHCEYMRVCEWIIYCTAWQQEKRQFCILCTCNEWCWWRRHKQAGQPRGRLLSSAEEVGSPSVPDRVILRFRSPSPPQVTSVGSSLHQLDPSEPRSLKWPSGSAWQAPTDTTRAGVMRLTTTSGVPDRSKSRCETI